MAKGDIILFDWGDEAPTPSPPKLPPTNPAERVEWLRARKYYLDEWLEEDIDFLFDELDRLKNLTEEDSAGDCPKCQMGWMLHTNKQSYECNKCGWNVPK